MMRKVPLLLLRTFNDGSAVPKELLKAIREAIFVAFAGWTVAGEVEGAYRMQETGHKQIDRLLEVLARPGNEVFEVGTSTVEFILSLPPENPTDEQRGGTAPTS